jgi:hypothetical protein
MNKFFIYITICFLSFKCYGQTHIKKQKFFEIQVGAYDNLYPNKDNYSFAVKFGSYGKKLNANTFGIAYNRKNTFLFDDTTSSTMSISIPIEQYVLSYKTDLRLYNNYVNTVFIRGVFGGNLGYESINREKSVIQNYDLKYRSDYIFGVNLGIEAEFTPFVIGVTENINFVSKYQKLSAIPYIGLRLHFF